ncbi:MAG TPA: P-II family nitrogen regulator [Saprospiraceae bacterium]|nr:P-II family nitrogen regulator [Saprospiraceae bacterium]MCB9271809.1 transcriptional regulator [Lewinellaceae bacterium]HPG09311.1 P-II family nitrogen regulator [Saprospiraceae bacterium]HQU53920.1 P-II family nitrogen regulator [Saprospiraceae bacterium]HRV86827.1 P-II family nitrogen regulator [Saprospiraceae bacterium]
MKLITAIIRETKLDQVREALIQNEIERITVSRVSGHGRQRGEEIYRGRKVVPNLIPKIKLEIAVNEAFVDITVNTIIEAAKSNPEEVKDPSELIGDGKIWITHLEECIRIRTEERGSDAI